MLAIVKVALVAMQLNIIQVHAPATVLAMQLEKVNGAEYVTVSVLSDSSQPMTYRRIEVFSDGDVLAPDYYRIHFGDISDRGRTWHGFVSCDALPGLPAPCWPQ